MKIRYQWALKNPRGWEEVDSSEWANLPKRPIPLKGELGGEDNQEGWIRNVNVQGLTNEGYDHVAIEEVTIGNDIGVKMTSWNNDPDDAHVDGFENWVNEPHAVIWTILPLAPDPKLGMAINTRQSCKIYATGLRYDRLVVSPPQNTTVRPWSEFIPPAEEKVKHGVWIEETKFKEHVDKAPQHEWGWMHWCEHLPNSETEIEKGRLKLKEQRAQGRYKQAEHTITYYQRSTSRAVSFDIWPNEDALELTTGVSSTQSVTVNASAVNCWTFTSPASQPNSADWPSGDFHVQLNCTAVSVGLTYNLNSASGVSSAYIYRLNSSTALIDGLFSSVADVSGTGLKLITTTVDFPAGSASDLFCIPVNAHGTAHGDAITLTLNTTDSYADGPWTTEAPFVAVASTVWPTLPMLGMG